MPDIFTGAGQRIESAVAKIIISDGVYYTAPISIRGKGANVLDYVLLESAAFGEQTATQKSLTLDNALFMVAFGDRPTVIRLQGYAFPSVCNEKNASGITGLYDFYRALFPKKF